MTTRLLPPMRLPSMRRACAVLAVLALAPSALAQPQPTVVNLWSAQTIRFDRFGSDLHFLGDLLVVGARAAAPAHLCPGCVVGAVYVFRDTGSGPSGGWTEEAELQITPPRIGNSSYGFSVGACEAPNGDTYVVGGAAFEAVENPERPNVPWIEAGAAYVHRRDAATGAWSFDARLGVPDPRDDAHAGTAVGLACGTTATGETTVEAFVRVDTRVVMWHRDGPGAWSLRQTFAVGSSVIPTGGVTSDIVASPPGPVGAAGGTYVVRGRRVLRRSGPESAPWVPETVLSSPLTGPGDLFGAGLDAEGDFIVVGSPNSPFNAPSTRGRVHIFRYTGSGPFGGWEEEAVLAPTPDRPSFGGEVAVWAGPAGDGVGARVVVRSDGDNFVYRRDAAGVWREEAVIPSGALPGGNTNVDGRWIAVGDEGDDVRGPDAGVVHLLDLRSVVAGEGAASAGGVALTLAGPNPARARTALMMTLPEAQTVAVGLFDALGRRVAVLHEGALAAGTTQVAVDVSGVPPGVYVVRAVGAGVAASVRLVVAR